MKIKEGSTRAGNVATHLILMQFLVYMQALRFCKAYYFIWVVIFGIVFVFSIIFSLIRVFWQSLIYRLTRPLFKVTAFCSFKINTMQPKIGKFLAFQNAKIMQRPKNKDVHITWFQDLSIPLITVIQFTYFWWYISIDICEYSVSCT